MANINLNKITNANLYSSGNSYLGKLEELTLPAIKAKFVEQKALGMIMGIELPSGFEMMTGKMKFNAVYPELISEFGSPYITRQVQVRSNLETYDSSGRIAEVPIVAFMSIRFKDVLPPITLKQNDSPDLESEFSSTYYRLEVDGNRIIEVDAFAQIFFLNDDDQLVNYRIALGL
jgi:P2 family phage contractile tail tube protein